MTDTATVFTSLANPALAWAWHDTQGSSCYVASNKESVYAVYTADELADVDVRLPVLLRELICHPTGMSFSARASATKAIWDNSYRLKVPNLLSPTPGFVCEVRKCTLDPDTGRALLLVDYVTVYEVDGLLVAQGTHSVAGYFEAAELKRAFPGYNDRYVVGLNLGLSKRKLVEYCFNNAHTGVSENPPDDLSSYSQ